MVLLDHRLHQIAYRSRQAAESSAQVRSTPGQELLAEEGASYVVLLRP